MLPFSNPLLIYELTAQQLQEHLRKSLTQSNYGDQVSGLRFEYKEHDKDGKIEYEIGKIFLDGKTTQIDVNDTTTTYSVCLPKYNATLKGSVTEHMQPINNENSTYVDNEAVIKVLEEERGSSTASEFRIGVDLNPRAILAN